MNGRFSAIARCGKQAMAPIVAQIVTGAKASAAAAFQTKGKSMNSDTILGATKDIAGQAKEGLGAATNDRALEAEGKGDQLGGQVQKGYGQAKDAVLNEAGPLFERAKTFARERPWAFAALAGTIGLAVINSLRGKR